MRRPLRGLAWIGAVLAISAAPPQSRAQENRYWLMSANDAIASIGDFAGRIRNGDVVRFDIVLLRRQPVRVGDIDAYWAEGLQEIDCVKHSTRVTLTAGLSLDRSRRVAQPPTQQRDWGPILPNTSMKTIEDFACRGVVRPPIRAVDLTSFQREFAPGRPAVAAAPTAPQPTPKPPAPAQSQARDSAPPSVATARYYLLGRTDQGDVFLQPSQLFVADNLVHVTTRIMLPQLLPMGGGEVAGWRDGDAIIDCKEHRWRFASTRLGTLDRSDFVDANDTKFGPWTPIAPNGAWARGEALMCGNRLAPGVTAVNDLVAYARQSMEKEADRAIASAKDALEEIRRNPPKIPAGPRYYVTSYDKESVEVFDRSTFRREGAIVTMRSQVLTLEPRSLAGQPQYWTERTYQFDCENHRSRWSLLAVYSLDHKDRTGMPSASLTEWTANSGTVDRDTENLLCSEKVVPRLIPATDLADLQRSYFAYARSNQASWRYGSQAVAAAPPAAVPAPRTAAPSPAPAQTRHDYVLSDVNKEGATVLDRASIRKSGDVVSYTELTAVPEPDNLNGREFWWFESTDQIDCKAHRMRVRVSALLSLDRREREANPDASYDEWIANKKDSQGDALENLVCQGKGAADFEPVPDLDKFQRDFLAAIKAGVVKD